MSYPSVPEPPFLSVGLPAPTPTGGSKRAIRVATIGLLLPPCQHGPSSTSPDAQPGHVEEVGTAVSDASLTSDPAALRDPHRVAAARRLFVEVPGPAAFDRLSRLAARLVGARHAKVTLFTDQDTVVGGFGLPEGVVGGPALLTGALSAMVVRPAARPHVPSARGEPPRPR